MRAVLEFRNRRFQNHVLIGVWPVAATSDEMKHQIPVLMRDNELLPQRSHVRRCNNNAKNIPPEGIQYDTINKIDVRAEKLTSSRLRVSHAR